MSILFLRIADNILRLDFHLIQMVVEQNTRPGPALAVAQACAAMDDRATSFELLEGYYFGQGKWAALAPPGGDQDRQTSPLFQPPMCGLWNDRQFAALVQQIGLNEYWQRSGSRPDYQRAPTA